MLRKIDRFPDLSTLREQLTPFYSAIGRPSIGPELMVRMLVVGYCASAFVRSGAFARRLTSIWHNAGFVGWDWKARSRPSDLFCLILVHRHLPIESLLAIACYNSVERDRVDALVQGARLGLNVISRPGWYF